MTDGSDRREFLMKLGVRAGVLGIATQAAASLRSLVHFTGRPRRFAAQTTATCSGYRLFLRPNAPPTSGDTTRMRSGESLSAAASVAFRRTTPWFPEMRVQTPMLAS